MKLLERIPEHVWTLVLFLIALVVRLLHITDTDIAGDEPFSIFMAQFPVAKIIAYLNTGNNPPLFEIVLHYYMLWVGDSDFLLRLFPSVLSALTAIPIFLIGSRFLSRSVGVAAALLFVFSIYNIRFAHEIRVYSLFTLSFAWVLFFFLAAVKTPDKLKYWVGLLVGNTILLYAHYLSFYVLLVQGITGLLFLQIKHWKYLIGMFLLTALAFAPSVIVFVERFGEVSEAGTWVQPPGWGEVYGSINLLLNSRITTVLVVLIIILGSILNGEIRTKIRVREILSKTPGAVIILWFVVPYGLMFLVSKFYLPMFIDRYVLFTSVPLFLFVSWVINEFWKDVKHSWVGGLLLVVASTLTTNLNPDNNREIAAAVKQVAELKTPNTQVYVAPRHFNLAFAYHFDQELFRLLGNDEPTSSLDSALQSQGIHTIRTKDELSLNTSRIVYLDAASEFVNPDNGILNQLRAEKSEVESFHHHEIFDIYVFE